MKKMRRETLYFIMLFFLVGCSQQSVFQCNSFEEAMDAEFSGDFKDLDFCVIIVNDDDHHTVFPFIHGAENCDNILQSCKNEGCKWSIRTGAWKESPSECWNTKHTGECVCHYDMELVEDDEGNLWWRDIE